MGKISSANARVSSAFLYRQWGAPSTIIDNGHDGKIVLYLPDSTSKNKHERKYINTGKPVEYITPRNNEYKRTKTFYITPMGNIYAWKWG